MSTTGTPYIGHRHLNSVDKLQWYSPMVITLISLITASNSAIHPPIIDYLLRTNQTDSDTIKASLSTCSDALTSSGTVTPLRAR